MISLRLSFENSINKIECYNPLSRVCVCVCVCVCARVRACVCVHVYVVYEDTNVHNDMVRQVLQGDGDFFCSESKNAQSIM